jgi:hypothetical protein
MSEIKPTYKIDGRPSTIFRVAKTKANPYVMIDKRIIDNVELSFKAKGILVYLLSRPDGWEVNLVDLTNRSTEGLSAIKSGCKELKEMGYLKHAGIRRTDGRFETVIWEVHEVPQVDNRLTDTPQVGVDPEVDFPSPEVDYPRAEKPHADNRMQVVLSTLSIKGNEDIKEKKAQIYEFSFWDTLVELIESDRSKPRILAQKIAMGSPLDWQPGTKTLTIGHPDPEWAKQIFGNTMNNMVQGLCPGATIQFQGQETA